MAIVQISRITARKGLEQDLPQPLAGAELGWAVDQRRLFIGNGELAEGAPVVGNTEVLTEFSDILGFAATYTYAGAAAGYTVQTGPTTGDPVSQSLQSRLDSYAVVTDFGATGDGSTDDTAAINRALNQLYCQQSNTQIRRSLFFPAGTYIVTDTIKVPPYACLYGEGADSSIISFYVENWTSTVAYAEGVLVNNSGSYYRSNAAVPIGTGIGNTLYWSPESLPEYVIRTADSLQQVGVNIATNGATVPTNIECTNLAVHTNMIQNGVLIEDANQVYFNSVNFIGPLAKTDLTVASDDIAAIRFASTASLISKQTIFDQCKLSGFTYGIATGQEVQGITVSNSWLDTLYQGIVLNDDDNPTGATGFRIMHNMFDNIYAQGVIISGVSLNATGYNIFYDVGNHFNGSALPAASIISIDADNNLSVGDMFERTTAFSTTYPRIDLNNTASIGIDNATRLQLGTYIRETGQSTVLVDGSTSATLFTVNTNYVKAFKMDYTIVRDTAVRTGTMTVVCNAEDSAGDFSYSDDFQENNTTDITLTPSESYPGSTITMSYTATGTGTDASFYYSLTHLA